MNLKITPRLAFTLTTVFFTGCADLPPLNQPVAKKAPHQITEIHMLDVKSGWAWSDGLAENRLLLRTADGGVTWTDVTPREFPFRKEEGACFRDAQTAWLPVSETRNAGDGLLRTTDGGKSWLLLNRTNTPIFNESSSCHFFSSMDGVGSTCDGGLGSAYYTFFQTRDSGKRWKPIPLTPPTVESSELSHTFHLSNMGGDQIAFYPPSTTIITFGDTADEQPKGVVRLSLSTDLGKTWRDLKLPLPEQYRDNLSVPLQPVFLNGKNIVLVTHVFKSTTNNSYANGALIFYTSNDGGNNWTGRQGIIDLNQPRSGDDFDVVSVKNFFVRNGANLYVTHDGAQHWQAIEPNIVFGGNSGRDVLQMDFVDAIHGWMIVSDNRQSNPNGSFFLYRTSDGGKTWAELPPRITH